MLHTATQPEAAGPGKGVVPPVVGGAAMEGRGTTGPPGAVVLLLLTALIEGEPSLEPVAEGGEEEQGRRRE